MVQKRKETVFQRLRYKYRLVIFNDDTFEEKLSFKLSRLNVFVITGLAIILLISGTTLLIAYTPLREYIPGYSSTRLRRQALELVQATDSIEIQLLHQKQYIDILQKIIAGEEIESSQPDSVPIASLPNEEALKPSEREVNMRKRVEDAEKFNIEAGSNSNSGGLKNLAFFVPVKGVVSQEFSPDKNHPAVDILAPENTAIKACLNGYVLFAEWTAETGHVLIIQHSDDLISIYKHNSALLKKQGNLVRAGEAIAIIGNSGEFTTGTHLHFELWHEGIAIDPQKFMRF